jgi:hypothetical protein
MSTSNDGTAMLWSLDGQQLAVMPHPPSREGQPSFVLSGNYSAKKCFCNAYTMQS